MKQILAGKYFLIRYIIDLELIIPSCMLQWLRVNIWILQEANKNDQ